MPATVADIINIMGVIAPPDLAEEWDNAGLQVGCVDWPVDRVWIALDPSPDVVAAACRKKVNLLITHHPLIFRPLNAVNFDSAIGSAICAAAKSRLAIFAAHTNFDSAIDGLNDTLARRIGLSKLRPLVRSEATRAYKLLVYVPVKYEQEFLQTILEAQSGEIVKWGEYIFQSIVDRTFEQKSSMVPAQLNRDDTSPTKLLRYETTVGREDLDKLLSHIKKRLPGNEVVCELSPLVTAKNDEGLGRVGELVPSMDLESLARHVKQKLKLASLKVAGDLSMAVSRAAVCTGSGSGLIKDFLSSEAQVFISGDLHYHDAKEALANNLGLMDIGHFASEQLIIEVLAERLSGLLTDKNFSVNVEACRLEKDPFLSI